MLRPVDANYDPGYPKRLTAAQIEELLRPGLYRRFAAPVLAAGAVAAGLALYGCAVPPPAPPDSPFLGVRERDQATAPELPREGHSSREEPLKSRVEQLTAELLGPHHAPIFAPYKELYLRREMESNPPVKYPLIHTSFGNSSAGVLDAKTARQATMRLFEAWGISLQPDHSVSGPGYQFVADGYNPELRIGFKLLQLDASDDQIKGMDVVQFAAKVHPGGDASEEELQALDKSLEHGDLRMFVADRRRLMELDFYVASVIDYLNWVHGDRQIELDSVLGEKQPDTSQSRLRPPR